METYSSYLGCVSDRELRFPRHSLLVSRFVVLKHASLLLPLIDLNLCPRKIQNNRPYPATWLLFKIWRPYPGLRFPRETFALPFTLYKCFPDTSTPALLRAGPSPSNQRLSWDVVSQIKLYVLSVLSAELKACLQWSRKNTSPSSFVSSVMK